MARLALNVIAKDQKDDLLRIVTKYNRYFDEICLAIDDRKVFEELKKAENKKIRAFHYTHKNEDGLLDFAHKRNFLKNHTRADYIFRLDTDDSIENPHKLDGIVDFMDKENIQVITCMYDYSVDEWGNRNAVHYRETIIENSANLYWNKPIHECIIPKNPRIFSLVSDETLRITHHVGKDHSKESAERNIKYLVKEFNRDKENTDPRTLGYLARTLHGLGHLDKAVYFYERHIEKSGWTDDRYLSWCQLGTIFKALNQKQKAKACAFEALQEKPDFPDAYFLLHDLYFDEDKWKEALEWADMGFRKPFPKTNVFLDPSSYTWRPMLSTAECCFQLGDFERASKIFANAKKLIPNHEYIKKTEPIYKEALEHSRYVSHFMWLHNFLKDKAPDKVENLLGVIPKDLNQHEVISRFRHEYTNPRIWGEKEIAIFCGGTPMDWSPKSTEKGVGGSEEAVIYLSQELNKRGYKVTVYNCCGEDEGNYDGIEWKNLVHFNPKDAFNILISWRSNVFAYKIQARNKIVWLHDLPNLAEWTEDTAKTVDKVVVLSIYHASLLPGCVPKEKIYISTNGVKPSDFAEIKEVKRNPKRIIYASSYDRGLEEMLQMWPEIREQVPDAELHAFYGWDTYDNYLQKGLIKDKGFKNRMLPLLRQDGVYEHGRIGHKELLKEYAKSGIYAYYCTYAGEINCIALTKAISCGCAVVTNDFAVMKERSPNVSTNDNFKDNLIDILKNPNGHYPKSPRVYLHNNSWGKVADDWGKNLFPIPCKTEVLTRARFIWDGIKKNEETIVDIGSNKGHIFNGWDRKYITSVDLDKYDIPNFIQADATELPIEDKKYDVAVLAEILEHIPDAVKAISEARRVAKRVIITVPYEHEWQSYLKPFHSLEKEKEGKGMTAKELAKFGNPVAEEFHDDEAKHLYHIRYYTPETLTEDLKKAGFKKFNVVKLRRDSWSWLGAIAHE